MRYVFEKVDDLLNATVIFGYDKIGYWARRPLWDCCRDKHFAERQSVHSHRSKCRSGQGNLFATAELGATIYMLCRNQQRGQDAQAEIINKTGNEAVFLEIVDMSSQQQIRHFANNFQKESNQLDILINNAWRFVE